jgi:hypothetical protein
MLVQRYLGPQRPAVPQKLNLKRRRTAAEGECAALSMPAS